MAAVYGHRRPPQVNHQRLPDPLLQWQRNSKPPTTQHPSSSPKVERVVKQVFSVSPPHARRRETKSPSRAPLQEVTILETGQRRNSKPPVDYSSRAPIVDRQRERDAKIQRYDSSVDDENITAPSISTAAFDEFQTAVDTYREQTGELRETLIKYWDLLDETSVFYNKDELNALLFKIQQFVGIDPEEEFNFEQLLEALNAQLLKFQIYKNGYPPFEDFLSNLDRAEEVNPDVLVAKDYELKDRILEAYESLEGSENSLSELVHDLHFNFDKLQQQRAKFQVDEFQEQLDQAEQLVADLTRRFGLLNNSTTISKLREDEVNELMVILQEIQQLVGIDPKEEFNFEQVIEAAESRVSLFPNGHLPFNVFLSNFAGAEALYPENLLAEDYELKDRILVCYTALDEVKNSLHELLSNVDTLALVVASILERREFFESDGDSLPLPVSSSIDEYTVEDPQTRHSKHGKLHLDTRSKVVRVRNFSLVQQTRSEGRDQKAHANYFHDHAFILPSKKFPAKDIESLQRDNNTYGGLVDDLEFCVGLLEALLATTRNIDIRKLDQEQLNRLLQDFQEIMRLAEIEGFSLSNILAAFQDIPDLPSEHYSAADFQEDLREAKEANPEILTKEEWKQLAVLTEYFRVRGDLDQDSAELLEDLEAPRYQELDAFYQQLLEELRLEESYERSSSASSGVLVEEAESPSSSPFEVFEGPSDFDSDVEVDDGLGHLSAADRRRYFDEG